MTHGKLGTYTNQGCRCADCTAAQRDYHRDYVHRTARQLPHDLYLALRYPEPPPHGTESRYTGHKCRCDLCKQASADARYKRRFHNREAARAYDREYKRRRRAAA